MMFTWSNVLSLIRGPLAFLFLINKLEVRALIILAAVLTDCIDGYLARKYKHTTTLGAILDPLMDKFFVLFVLFILFFENKLSGLEMIAMLSRDIALFGFSIYLFMKKRWRTYHYHSLMWGKVTTSFQFLILFLLTFNIHLPFSLFILFITLGLLFAFELFFTLKSNPKKS